MKYVFRGKKYLARERRTCCSRERKNRKSADGGKIFDFTWLSTRPGDGGDERNRSGATRLFVRVNYTSTATFLHERFRVCN